MIFSMLCISVVLGCIALALWRKSRAELIRYYKVQLCHYIKTIQCILDNRNLWNERNYTLKKLMDRDAELRSDLQPEYLVFKIKQYEPTANELKSYEDLQVTLNQLRT